MSIKQLTKEKLRALLPDKAKATKEEAEKPRTKPKAIRQQMKAALKDIRSEKTQSKPYYSYISTEGQK
ncbi:uncharacterized protein AB675_11266 [Cyphellophora attinorum]|uniref:Uncharacterized protein n=1 Tax=Cyphellophora attinorum TaxID=1664694 RepID=A0A0N1HAW0_9EURO|nr:uncharacterized protein AB675_11266 [Phialophora attinorum]KPI40017.1 hypothetical protein AB675_11266 [Phialophora attinorum]